MEEGPSPPKIMRIEEKVKKINIIVKTYFQKIIVEVEEDASVGDLKRLVAERFDCCHRRLCFIWGGKIMKDTDSLEVHGFKDGDLIHLLIKGASSPSTQWNTADSPAANDNTTSSVDNNFNDSIITDNVESNRDNVNNVTPSDNDDDANEDGFPSNSASSPSNSLDEGVVLSGMTFLNLNPDFSRRYQNMGRELADRPGRLWRAMEDPWVQELMADSEVLPQVMALTQQLMADRQLLHEVMAYPQAERLSQIDYDVNQLLQNTSRDPDVSWRIMDSASDPAILSALQDVVRSQSPALPDLESTPGSNALQYSYSILQHVYRDFQDDPLVDESGEHSWRSGTPGDVSPERTPEDADTDGSGVSNSARFFDEVD